MAGIQQSVNQALGSAQFAAGLYAHTPMGQEQAELNLLKRKEATIAEQVASTEQTIGPKSTPEQDQAYTEAFESQVKNLKRQWELDPTEERFKEYTDVKSSLNEWKEWMKTAEKSSDARIAQKATIKDKVNKRIRELKNARNRNVNRERGVESIVPKGGK